MSDEVTMRARLQTVAAYRELCRSVRRSGRENVVYACLMFGFAYFVHTAGGPQSEIVVLLYGILGFGELLVGLYKWAFPSAEGLILDALVLLAFVGVSVWLSYDRFQRGWGISPISVFFNLYMFFAAINRFKAYGELSRLFAERPDPEHVAWFDDLVREIQASDPISWRSICRRARTGRRNCSAAPRSSWRRPATRYGSRGPKTSRCGARRATAAPVTARRCSAFTVRTIPSSN